MGQTTIETRNGPFAALQWQDPAGAPTDAPRLHFAHATGMHAGLYARLLAPLADRFRITATNARGHGASPGGHGTSPGGHGASPGGHGASPGGPVGDRIEWEAFAADTLAVIDAVDPGVPWLLAGHSLGGSTSLLAAALRPERVAGLVLLDPPFIPFEIARAAAAAGTALPNPMADQAGRRRADFPDVAAARAAWQGRGVFRQWSDDDLDAYLADGLRASGNGVTLACTPAWEAATFRGVSHRIEAALAALDCPFALVAGETGSTVPPAEFALMAAHRRCVRAERLAGTTHFVPLERGEAVRAAIDRVAVAAVAAATAAV